MGYRYSDKKRAGRGRRTKWKGARVSRGPLVWWEDVIPLKHTVRLRRMEGELVEVDEARGVGTVRFRNGRRRAVEMTLLRYVEQQTNASEAACGTWRA